MTGCLISSGKTFNMDWRLLGKRKAGNEDLTTDSSETQDGYTREKKEMKKVLKYLLLGPEDNPRPSCVLCSEVLANEGL